MGYARNFPLTQSYTCFQLLYRELLLSQDAPLHISSRARVTILPTTIPLDESHEDEIRGAGQKRVILAALLRKRLVYHRATDE